jgi:hypothetical protein
MYILLSKDDEELNDKQEMKRKMRLIWNKRWLTASPEREKEQKEKKRKRDRDRRARNKLIAQCNGGI